MDQEPFGMEGTFLVHSHSKESTASLCQDWEKSGMFQVEISTFSSDCKVAEFITQNLPSTMTLDGELWTGRGTFHKIQPLVRRKNVHEENWKDVVFKGNFLCSLKVNIVSIR